MVSTTSLPAGVGLSAGAFDRDVAPQPSRIPLHRRGRAAQVLVERQLDPVEAAPVRCRRGPSPSPPARGSG